MSILKERMHEGFIFQQDGAPHHFHNEVTSYLNAEVPVWIGRGSVSPWPARSTDLTPLDFSKIHENNVRTDCLILNLHQMTKVLPKPVTHTPDFQGTAFNVHKAQTHSGFSLKLETRDSSLK
ncbi:hypothetical protein AVEN_17744-1 [Araneus ventricosus]|uniref:Tc1-like transposase DDE domain-containing protein n=1 Tax=Araneus ventricosus TaxID=182803 RepID=A0A4Y2FCW5_ARAVE|nr:hypothetical protein AVEN_17744-1 [Araneus ventricosus]